MFKIALLKFYHFIRYSSFAGSIVIAALSTHAVASSFQFTTATGRAVITDSVPVELARMRALEDALYLAALQGGANINGFSSVSTDTSVQDHFVVRPSSKILDYTIISEDKADTQIEVVIRAAVGNLPEKKCQSTRPLNITLYKPTALIDMNVPAWIETYHTNLFNDIAYNLDKNPILTVKNALNVQLDAEKLKTIDERFDYASLMTSQVRVNTGDYAVIPSVFISAGDKPTKLVTSRQVEITLGLQVFNGSSYDLVEEFEQSITFETDKIALFQTFADLDKSSRNDMIDIMSGLIAPLTNSMIDTLGCQSLKDVLNFEAQQLTTQIGSNQGITPNMLAITSGKHTPWTVLRVVSVSSNTAILEPLDKARQLNELNGKTVEFMELN